MKIARAISWGDGGVGGGVFVVWSCDADYHSLTLRALHRREEFCISCLGHVCDFWSVDIRIARAFS